MDIDERRLQIVDTLACGLIALKMTMTQLKSLSGEPR